MSDEQKSDGTPMNEDRRKFLNTAAMVGLAGAGLSGGLISCKGGEKPEGKGGMGGGTEAAGEFGKYEVPPGKLDDYYMFSSGGHSGDVRIYGLPSGRTLKQIPVFNTECMIGWGITNESKAVIGTKPDGSVKYTTGDTHHVHGSYTDGTYDSTQSAPNPATQPSQVAGKRPVWASWARRACASCGLVWRPGPSAPRCLSGVGPAPG